MKTGIVLYKTKYGTTKKYAEWLSVALGFDSEDISEFDGLSENYDTIILCGGVYATGIGCLPFLKKHYKEFSGKRLAIFAVGASPYDEIAFRALKEHNLKGELKDIPLFYGRGAWRQDEMTFIDRTLCKILQKAVSKKDPATYEPWEQALMACKGQNADWSEKSYLDPVIEWYRNTPKNSDENKG